jgi:hypothetical protein
VLRRALLATIASTFAFSACGDDNRRQSASMPATNGPAAPTTPSTAPSASADDATIRITLGDTELTARLDDNATARDLIDQLPLQLTFRDHNGVEKTAPLPRKLSTAGSTSSHDPAAGDVGYYAPTGDLVLYYDDKAPRFDGIVRIGELTGDLEPLRTRPADFEATVDAGE